MLSDSQVQKMYQKFIRKREEYRQTIGFQSNDVDQLGIILEAAIKEKSGLSTLGD